MGRTATGRHLRRSGALTLAILGFCGSARGQLAAPTNEAVTGVHRDEREPGDTGREVAAAVLFVPRLATELFFTATGTVAGVIEEEQVVPRVDDLLHPPEGEVRVFPTAFLETGSSANIGVRVIAHAKNVVGSVRGGYGGLHDVVVESRLQLGHPYPLPFSIGLEAFHDQRSSLGFLGLGQHPESDPRNRFQPGAPTSASYREERERFIMSLGFRPLSDVEVLLSTSYQRRRVLDPPSSESTTIAQTFLPGSVPGYLATNQIIYSEVGARIDTRDSRGGPASGALFEGYFGEGNGTRGTNMRYARYGGRTAAFFPILSESNVLSPKVTVDGMDRLSGDVPFVELVRQPDFRGFDNRRDFASVVGSLDYRWTVVRYIGARVFADIATVAPTVPDLPLEDWRFAGGFAFDVFSHSTQLGSVGFSGSKEGFIFLLQFGVQSTFGDRQHRS